MTALLFTIQNCASRAQTAIFLKMAPVRLLGIPQTLKIALCASCAFSTLQRSSLTNIFDDELVLLAEDGGNFGSKDRPIAYRVSGKCWVNNHAHAS